MFKLYEVVSAVRELRLDKRGVTALEYGLIAAVIGAVLIAAVPILGTALTGVFNRISAVLNRA